MNYKDLFNEFIKTMDEDFNWTTTIDDRLVDELIKNEIGKDHKLYGKLIIPVGICTNKYDLLGYYQEKNEDYFIVIHFNGYKTSNRDDPSFDKYNSLYEAIEMIKNVYRDIYLQSRYNVMIDSEYIKREKTYQEFRGLYSKLPIIYDCLFKINEYRGERESLDDENTIRIKNLFRFYSSEFVYEIRSIFVLLEIGNYSDASVIVRSLTEKFFYFKYYVKKNNGKKLEDYVFQRKKRGIKIENIMNEIAPTYYETVYDELCNFTHGNPYYLGLFRGNVEGNNIFIHDIFSINKRWFVYVLNMTLPLINGYFSMFRKVYVNNTINKSKRLSQNIKSVEEFINKYIDDLYKANKDENSRNFLDLYKKIISFE